mmetsp:Transcript_13206/g.31011  ORF Transcript_13206/g.31011 Transcript_13206/m.31011 type:complete len:219 (+) Transcript_13206:554-1210(+)
MRVALRSCRSADCERRAASSLCAGAMAAPARQRAANGSRRTRPHSRAHAPTTSHLQPVRSRRPARSGLSPAPQSAQPDRPRRPTGAHADRHAEQPSQRRAALSRRGRAASAGGASRAAQRQARAAAQGRWPPLCPPHQSRPGAERTEMRPPARSPPRHRPGRRAQLRPTCAAATAHPPSRMGAAPPGSVVRAWPLRWGERGRRLHSRRCCRRCLHGVR